MLEGLFSAAAGMSAQQLQLDAVSNDLANANTAGYKSERVGFEDLLYNQVDKAGTETTAGAGAAARIIGRSQTQGALKETDEPLDLAIEGEGFFQVKRPGGSTVLTRNGAFQANARGEITDAAGNMLEPPIKLPAGVTASDVRIAADGTVSANGKRLGRIVLVTVTSPDHLHPEGGGLLAPTAASGSARTLTAGQVRQGALEDSNVDLGRDIATMMTTERAFQMSSTAIQTESQMMAIANQLRA
jgi:flagellar basal-body rod protein FlgG